VDVVAASTGHTNTHAKAAVAEDVVTAVLLWPDAVAHTALKSPSRAARATVVEAGSRVTVPVKERDILRECSPTFLFF